ncbi:MAG: polysaccharide biosynthesis/export family protein, partial [Myxococcota bacterium]
SAGLGSKIGVNSMSRSIVMLGVVIFFCVRCVPTTTTRNLRQPSLKAKTFKRAKDLSPADAKKYANAKIADFDLSYFRIDVGDVVYIKVNGEKIEGTYQVYPDCQIQMPLLEVVRICGKTPGRLRREIANALYKDFFKKRPSVVVKVTEFNSKKIYVFGEVKKAGRFDYAPGLTLMQIIAMAGGFSRKAARKDTRLIRTVGGRRRVYRVPLEGIQRRRRRNYYLRPGDMIYVPESWF